MTWALTVSEVIPSKLTLRAKLVPELLNKVKDAIPETKLLPKHISAVQHYITEVLANKFLEIPCCWSKVFNKIPSCVALTVKSNLI